MKAKELKADLEKLRRRYYPLNRKGKSQLLTELALMKGVAKKCTAQS